MTWLDRIIETISPRAAYMREGWRQQLGLIRGSGYDAADGGRLNKNWRATNEAADITDRYSRDTLRARARDLERNSDIANGVLKAFKRNVVGNGFTLQAKTGDDDLDDQIETLWRRWTRRTNCDVTQQQSFNELLRMAVVRKKADGGILFKKCYTSGGLLPFKLQALEVDELSAPWLRPGTREIVLLAALSTTSTTGPWGIGLNSTTLTVGKQTSLSSTPPKILFSTSVRAAPPSFERSATLPRA